MNESKMTKKRRVSRIRRLEIQEAKLRRELKGTLKDISKDTKSKKGGEEGHLDGVERQKLANRSVDIRSKLLRLQDEIGTREVIKQDKITKDVRTRIQESYSTAARKHSKLLWTTINLERMKEDENAIRAIAGADAGLETRKRKVTSPVERYVLDRREISSATSRISASSMRHSTEDLDYKALDRREHLEHVRESLSTLGLHSTRDQLQKADGLQNKYDATREMRNLTLGQMISRSNKNSYWRINPPYRRKRGKVAHVRRAYAKDFYENKIDMTEARDKNIVTPRTEVLKDLRQKEEDELGRFTMSSGRTMSMRKMKGFTPPGMKLSPLVEGVAQ
ncbi:uncharacterized protein LOC114536846 [Dendronephthya gigantea]|uniref:uncharacterized protein LOC114536846 n=1 Tax=Dendronephthya gigantea TaxID=151771 RepID=UPI00106A5CC4|nr:uncharacterized protein LOC114536846 [Dendronephthya gigantea]